MIFMRETRLNGFPCNYSFKNMGKNVFVFVARQ
jgi:hypothetical protein